MKKYISLILSGLIMFYSTACSRKGTLTVEDARVGEAVKINLINGQQREGMILKKKNTDLTYVDTESHKPEVIDLNSIRSLVLVNKTYDLEGNIVTEKQISDRKGISKTMAYGAGGFVLGAAAGFLGGALLLSEDKSFNLIYPMGGLALVGGIYFAIKGGQSDREDAIDSIRKERYKVTEAKLKKKLAEEKKKLEILKKEEKRLQKEKKPGQ